MNEEQDAPRFLAHALRSVGETKPLKSAKFLIANLELEFHISPRRISDLKFSNRKKKLVLRAPWRIAVCIFTYPSLEAPPARVRSHFDAPLRIPYNRGILSARRRARRRLVYKVVEDRIRKALRHHIHERYKTDVPIATERPPKLAMGEAASPVCFELAKRLKKPPRALAQEIANSLKPIPGVARVEVAGAGYLNFFFDRTEFFRSALIESTQKSTAADADAPKTIVEHTAINPNKAAHIGHLRNAVLGDTFVRLLRRAGRRVEIQNYIDNTGVQIADVVLGFLHLEKKSIDDVRALTLAPRFDYVCWDLYTRVTHFLAEDKSRLELRAHTLKEIEEGQGEAARMAELVATAIVHCHLETLDRLGIDYDLLTQESEILHLKFWDAAFDMLKKSGAIQLATAGKTAGCWVMQLPSDREAKEGQLETPDEANDKADDEPAEQAEAKIIVRSNGTVTYVGKDIAYHLWKFGLLDRDFHYQRFHTHPDGHEAWVTSSDRSDAGRPPFGHAQEVFNVVDSRQAYPQQVVAAGLRALGYTEQADRLKHFAYNVVALTPRCAREMGYEIPEEDAKKPYVEVSGRKGQGVKADDLLDQLQERARQETDSRHPEMAGTVEAHQIANAVAVGALRYFLLRFTRSTVIAFDFKDALSFEGETGPYVQYAVVRVQGIARKGVDRLDDLDAANILRIDTGDLDIARFLEGPADNDVWELAVITGSLDARVQQAVSAQEPAFIARYAFELAQAFNGFYHQHPILNEADPEKRAFLLRLIWLVREQLVATLSLMGIVAPEKM
jgi:arginyl-tRNA synthetase